MSCGSEPKPARDSEGDLGQSRAAIIRGELAPIGSYANIALLYSDEFACTGTLINPSWVLTTATCLSIPGGLRRVSIVFQGPDGEALVEVLPRRALVHPQYTAYNAPTRFDYDVGLIELGERVWAPRVRLVTAAEMASLPPQTLVTATGLGLMEDGTMSYPDLQRVELPLFGQRDCEDAYRAINPVTARMLCAGFAEGGKGVCDGDGGAPLFADVAGNQVQIGIASWSNGCAQPGYPGVFTRVAEVRDFIDRNAVDCTDTCQQRRDRCTASACGCETMYASCMTGCGEFALISPECCEANCAGEHDGCNAWNDDRCFCFRGLASCRDECAFPLEDEERSFGEQFLCGAGPTPKPGGPRRPR